MSATTLTERNLVRQAVIEVAQLPEEELLLLVDFLNYLKDQRAQQATRAQIRTEAIQRAERLRRLPREQRAAQLLANLKRLNTEAVAKGVAIEGEWRDD
ncbi:MAG: hypothetical protein ABI874_02920 [Chloroflexota bacterium]